jgi:D-amino-acid dehydrogenase/Ca-activated chloride channel family protein
MQHLLALLAEDYRSSVTTFVNFDPQVKVDHRRPDEKIVLPEDKKLHISILLDASGSMGQEINGKTKMDSAKDAIKKFSEKLPQNAQISLRVYGNEGTGSRKDKEVSCKSTKEIFHGTGKESKDLQTALEQVEPAGWTPIANALQTVKQDIQPETTDSVVYVVSDGMETCGGNPVQVAKELNQAKVRTIVNIIGFDVDNAGQRMLKEVAESGGGEFASVDNEQALHKYLEKAYDDLAEAWEKWKEKGMNEAESQKESKMKIAEDTKKSMMSLVEIEKAHLEAADEYLKQKRGDEYPHSDVYNKIIDRYSLVWRYAVDTGNDLWRQAVDSGNNEWNNFVDEGSKKWLESKNKKPSP